MKTPLQLFREGMDTKAIARELECSEAAVYNTIHHERQAILAAADKIERRRAYARWLYNRRKQINAAREARA
jgi:predicted transcriptional regulator